MKYPKEVIKWELEGLFIAMEKVSDNEYRIVSSEPLEDNPEIIKDIKIGIEIKKMLKKIFEEEIL